MKTYNVLKLKVGLYSVGFFSTNTKVQSADFSSKSKELIFLASLLCKVSVLEEKEIHGSKSKKCLVETKALYKQERKGENILLPLQKAEYCISKIIQFFRKQ